MKACALAAVVLLTATPVFAACTAEELQTKALALTEKMQVLAAKDAAKAGEIGEKFGAVQTATASDIDKACKAYDDLLAEVDAAQ